MSMTLRVLAVGVLGSLTVAGCGASDASHAVRDGGATDGGGGRASGSGGRASGGAAATGGRASGGATATGGRASGGATGTGGRATGGTSGSGGSALIDAGDRDARTDASDGSTEQAPADASDASFDGADAGGNSDAGPGCPTPGKYSMTSSGSGCGDFDVDAPEQRFDASNCSGSFEYDGGGGRGVSGSAAFNDDGTLSATELGIGSATMACTAQATVSAIALTCSGEGGTCFIAMTRTGPL